MVGRSQQASPHPLACAKLIELYIKDKSWLFSAHAMIVFTY